jgi:glycogen phosphorylase
MTTSRKPTVAYFCMEYGVSPELPIYSGGLGVLAGDTMKSAGDLKLPVLGIGLFWHEGYTRQIIGKDGQPEDQYVSTSRDALEPVEVSGVEVEVLGKTVPLRAFKVKNYLSSTLYLLEPAEEEDRWITKRLYGGGDEDRLAQEIILGVGGVRLLRALGVEVEVYHFNEGHAVFAGLELLREQMAAGADLEKALAAVRPQVVFTTHTPVAAGNETHDLGTMAKVGADVGIERPVLERLGGTPFSMTVAGLRLAHRANAVAQLHGETAKRMWHHVKDGAPIIAITNGVHHPTWQDARIRDAMGASAAPARREGLWTAHQALKAELIAGIKERAGVELKDDVLLVGFARRATAYKRADLIFGEPERLDPLFREGKLQLVFSGKAHPKDQPGKALIARLVEASKRWPHGVVFLENYDMTLGALLTRGCDVWLNNPRRPMEASGTSGMKAAMNGCLNASILDGWWPEGCEHGVTGWQIGDTSGDALAGNVDEQDARDRAALYETLVGEVVPTYYKRRERWIEMMESSISMSQRPFSSDRMVEEYFSRLYAPDEA